MYIIVFKEIFFSSFLCPSVLIIVNSDWSKSKSVKTLVVYLHCHSQEINYLSQELCDCVEGQQIADLWKHLTFELVLIMNSVWNGHIDPFSSQVTVQYRQDHGAMLPVRVHTVVISVQHDEDICLDEMRDALKEKVVKAVVPCVYLDDDTIYHLQPSGRFVIGGPQVTFLDWSLSLYVSLRTATEPLSFITSCVYDVLYTCSSNILSNTYWFLSSFMFCEHNRSICIYKVFDMKSQWS